MESQKITGSHAVMLSLIEEEVETIFGYVGGAIMPIYDALFDYKDRVKHYLVRHEQGAIHAAQAYARTTGKVGVCFVTSGPGATNILTGIADAQMDSTPLVCISGQVDSRLLGTDAFQETDIIGLSMPITKWNFQITGANEIPKVLAKAFYIANTGRPGPVLIDITKDAQFALFDYQYQKCTKIRSYFPYRTIKDNDVDNAVELINSAKKPMILTGHGVTISNAQDELMEFAEKTDIPVSSTLLGLSAFPNDHRLYVGMLGMHGNYAPNVKTNECDLIIAIGMRFDDRITSAVNTYAKQAKIIHIEVDAAEIDKNVMSTVSINADAKEALIELNKKVSTADHKQWLKEFKQLEEFEYEKIMKAQLYPETEKIQMGEVVRMITEKTNSEALVVTDVGQHQMVSGRYFKFKNSRSFITSGGLGTMGFGLPASIGAKIAKPNKQIIAVIGDGGFQMTIQELGTIFQYKIPVKIVILNNNFLGMVRQWQQLFFEKRYSFTEMVNPNFVQIAKGYDIKAIKVNHRSELDSSLDKMLNSENAFILDIDVEKEENVFPMIPSGETVSNIRLS